MGLFHRHVHTEQGDQGRVELNCNCRFIAKDRAYDIGIQTDLEQETETIPTETATISSAPIPKKVGKKKKKGGNSSDKGKTAEEHLKLDLSILPVAAIETHSLESMNCDMEAKEQAPPSYSIPAKSPRTTVQIHKDIPHCHFLTEIVDVWRKINHKRHIQIKHSVTHTLDQSDLPLEDGHTMTERVLRY